MPMHRRDDRGGGGSDGCQRSILVIDKCHTLCESKYNIVEHIVQYLVLVKFLYVHVTAYLNDLVAPVKSSFMNTLDPMPRLELYSFKDPLDR